jgi:hypothetical protein
VSEDANHAEYPDWIKTVEDIIPMNSRICAMQLGEVNCLHCGKRIHRTAFNGNPIWEHETPPGERHGPWPRTHCATEPGHECPTSGCDRHARPNINQLMTAADRELLRSLGVLL